MTFTLGAGNDIFDTNAAYTVADVVYGGDGNDTMWTGEAMIRFTAVKAMTT